MRHHAKAVDAFVHVPRTGGSYLRELVDRHRHVVSWSVVEFPFHLESVITDRSVLFSHFASGLRCILPVRYHTILADPVTQSVSEWLHLRDVANPLRDKARAMDVDEFTLIRCGDWMARTLTGCCGQLRSGPLDARHLAMAVEELATYDTVGTSDTFEASANRFLDAIGIDERVEVRERRAAGWELTASQRATIEGHNALDIELLRRVCDAD